MYAIRVYKSFDTNKTELIRIVNSKTLEFKDFSIKDLKTILSFDKDAVHNLTLDSFGQVKMKRYNNKKINYYDEHIKGKYKIRLYCIITGYNKSFVNYIADDGTDSPICGSNVTLGEIANSLEVPLSELRLQNGVINKNGQKYDIYINTNRNSIYKLPSVNVDSVNDIFGNKWDVNIYNVSQEGIEVSFMEPHKEVGLAVIPEGVSYIDKFGLGVNHLVLPDSLIGLGDSCFKDNSDIMSIKLGRNLKVIPSNCFSNSTLKSIQFSGYETKICDKAFEDCELLKGSIITNARIIGKQAFNNTEVSKLKLFKVNIIDIEAFAYNDKLTEVEFGDNLEKIFGGAFRYCSKLKEIELPPSVIYVGKLAFDGCNRLKTVRLSRNTKIFENSFPKKTELIYY